MKTPIILIILIVISLGVLYYLKSHTKPPLIPTAAEINEPAPSTIVENKNGLVAPLSEASSRVTKKPFGIFVKPGASPVNPERFTGYHTATDFEILPGESDLDVAVVAVCSGKILRKETAQGYGGMVVTSCTIGDQPVTVVYGHIRLSAVQENIGDTLTQGKQFTVLGTGYSQETGSERKHLHLGIHKGASVDTRGYVSDQSQLSNWLDYQKLIANL